MSQYEKRGVSASKFEVHKAVQSLDKGLFPNAFCKVLPDVATGDNAYCSIMHADTAGTKTALAYLYWRETGDLSIWKGIVQDAIVMNLDDLACVGVTDNIILSNTIARNKNLIPGEVLEALIEGSEDFIQAMANYGVQIHHAGGETADVGDIVRTVDVGFTAYAHTAREKIIENDIQSGDVIVGLASFGLADYESSYNSGIGSNGLTMARHEVLSHDYAKQYPESFDPALGEDLAYTGKQRLTDKVNDHQTVGDMLLSPTRTYLPLLAELFKELKPAIHGIVHCTGGGQTKVKNFIQNIHVVKDHLFDTPEVFKLIQGQTKTDWQEMYQVFNMGHRMEIYLPEAYAQQVIDLARTFGIEAQVIGHCKPMEGEQVTIKEGDHVFTY